MKLQVSNVNYENWKSVTVKFNVPAEFQKLQEISKNLWWVWNYEAIDLFAAMDAPLWAEVGGNPVLFLQKLNGEKYKALSKDKAFIKRMNEVYANFRAYVDAAPNKSVPSIAYFSMEYGLTDVLKIYSGGLGVLAGDYLKEASDCNVNMTAVGFLYRHGYFTQELSMYGDQLAIREAQNFENLPLEECLDANGNEQIISLQYPNREVYAKLWRVNVGRVPLILLDTDLQQNSEEDRSLTSQLYGGDNEHRLKQEILLGIGGIAALKKLGVEKEIYHCNEGHAAFLNVQRLMDYMATGLSFNEAMELVRVSGLFTTHTPVPAGHDTFNEGLFQHYMFGYAQALGMEWTDFMNMGRENPGDLTEDFSVTVFACNTCQEVNGVSKLHGIVSQKMFQNQWKGYFAEESHVGFVTNGVHYPTWAVSEWKNLHKKYLGEGYIGDQSNFNIWKQIYNVPDEELWSVRCGLKAKLIDYIKTKFTQSWLKNQGDPSRIVRLLEQINPNALTIGFGRRFATYKRAHLLFTDIERLSRIVNDPKYPVQFFFTGKAHPADAGGQKLIKDIIEISRRPEFLGKVIFLENYDMALAKRLISGVDIWLNTPTRPLEASGTSGEKAQMNGVLNFSVLDGWWYEGYREGAGWALTDKRTYQNQQHQDQLDAATIYSMLENEIIPKYFAVNSKGYSPEWIACIKKSFSEITPDYTMKRMLDDYIERFYSKQAKRRKALVAKNNAKAKEIVAWKEQMAAAWDNIEVINQEMQEINHEEGQNSVYRYAVEIDTKNAAITNSIGVELVFLHAENGEDKFYKAIDMNVVKAEGSKISFELERVANNGGIYKYGLRMYPKNADLPHRQDFAYLRWL